MTKLTFIFGTYPTSKSNPNNEMAISNLFGSDPTIMQASAKTKSSLPEDSAFPVYLAALNEHINEPLQVQWISPFHNAHVLNLSSVKDEMLHTLWNFMAFLHWQIVEQDCTVKEGMQNIKYLLSDITALHESFGKVISNHNHPVFTPQLYAFMTCYHHYICSLFLFHALQDAKKPSLQICKAANRCLIELTQCNATLNSLQDEARVYFSPIISGLIKYFNGFICLNMGKSSIDKCDYRNGLGYYQKGVRFFEGNIELSNFATSVNTSVSMMKNAINSTFASAQHENKTIWFVATIPDPPDYPVAYKLDMTNFTPTPCLQIENGFKEDMQALEQSLLMQDVEIPGLGPPTKPPTSSDPPNSSGPPSFGGNNSSGAPPKFNPTSSNNSSDGGIPIFNPTASMPPSSGGAAPKFNPTNGGAPVFTPSGGAPKFTGNSQPPTFSPNNSQPSEPKPWTPPSSSNSNQSGGPPVWTPPRSNSNQSPPVWTPPGNNNQQNNAPVWKPPSQQGAPQNNSGSWRPLGTSQPIQQPNFSAQQNQFPNWNEVLQLKNNITARFQSLRQRFPNVAQVLNAYEQQFQQASSNDSIISSTIQNFLNGQNISKQQVDGMIGQASNFYNQLKSRLDQIEFQFGGR
ncbi:hypothetical protein GPJ56_000620 [Histomonas meleagridis]|uniref:uncharacterized protein n=1 Tax=Histomonas meleagridis TaxID=135588 RepID=UPI003559D656|nr:hypothetical protein GPJ56_000620 [Histomonas meleagridis]KAH0804747.1 hypothetical protein GO595_002441 [Histomonas meleagridis]